MLTGKDYCDYGTCVALKELGYKVSTSAYYIPNNETLYFVSNPYRGGYVIDCFYSHNSLPKGVMTSNYIDAPTMWEAQKWLREEKEINISPVYLFTDWGCIIKTPKYGDLIESHSSYEETLLEGIKEAVNILKEE